MQQFFLPAPDAELIRAVQTAITAWLQRCVVNGKPIGVAGAHWDATMTMNAFSPDRRNVYVRVHDVFGDEILQNAAKVSIKKAPRKVLTDSKLSKLEKNQQWNRMMAGPEQPEDEVRPDSFRYRERENYDDAK